MRDIGKILFTLAQIIAYIIAAIIIMQMIKKLAGGSWEIEDIILALVILNLTITFGIGGYLIHLNNKIAGVDRKIHGHIEWHKGKGT